MSERRLLTISIDQADIDLIRHIESVKIMNRADGAGFDPEGNPAPVSRDDAKELLDSTGYAAIVIEVPIETFTSGLVGDPSNGEFDLYDTLHEIAFGDFGTSEDSEYEVLGVCQQSSALIVRYTTRLSPFFVGESEETAYPSFR